MRLLDSNETLATRVRDLKDAFNANGALVRSLGSVIQPGDDEDEDVETATITGNPITQGSLNRLGNESMIIEHCHKQDIALE